MNQERTISDERHPELSALNEIIAALQGLDDNERRVRVLQTAATFFDIPHLPALGSSGAPLPASPAGAPQRETAFSQDRTLSPKEFLMQKQPATDVERVACLAYYLTHYRDTVYFKTLDISKLNTEAAQPKFSNPAVAVNNATLRNYLVQGTKGNKQLSARGEVFVQALPDKEAARAAMAASRPRRRRKSSQDDKQVEETGANE